jgi:hypothetical protein
MLVHRISSFRFNGAQKYHPLSFDHHLIIIEIMPFNIPQGTLHFGIPVAPSEVAPTFPNLSSREGGGFMQVPTIKRKNRDGQDSVVCASISKTPTTTRQKISGMNSEERLQWSRQQSAQHSKMTRDRHKIMEKVGALLHPRL